MKDYRSKPSEGLTFNHSTLVEKIKTRDALILWIKLMNDPHNPHMHRRAKFKFRWLSRKLDLLSRIV